MAISSILGSEPAVVSFGSGKNPQQGNITVNLVDRFHRKQSIWQIEDNLRKEFAVIPGLKSVDIFELRRNRHVQHPGGGGRDGDRSRSKSSFGDRPGGEDAVWRRRADWSRSPSPGDWTRRRCSSAPTGNAAPTSASRPGTWRPRSRRRSRAGLPQPSAWPTRTASRYGSAWPRSTGTGSTNWGPSRSARRPARSRWPRWGP